MHAAVAQRLGDRQVGVLELHVLADERDPNLFGEDGGPVDESTPAAQVGLGDVEPEVLAEDVVVNPLLVEGQRHLVHVRRRRRRRRRPGTGRLANNAIFRRISVDSTDSDRHMTMSGAIPILRSSLTECCVGLVLSSPAWPIYGTSVRVDEHAAPPADVDRELSDRLEERQRLDVADRPADLGDHEVDVARIGHQPDPVLDLVGDVRDDLDGRAEVVAAALAPDHACCRSHPQ